MLSKSQIMRGLQCDKSLWLVAHKPEERQFPNEVEGLFEQGTTIGELAQQLFPEGVLVKFQKDNLHAMASKTQELIAEGEHTIYEATFIQNGVFSSIDILHKNEQGWHLYEVKGSTKVKDIYITDAATQFVSVNNIIDIASINVVYVNNQYVYEDVLDVVQLFNIDNVTEKALIKMPELQQRIRQLADIKVANEEPMTDIGAYCSSPYPCDYSKYCRAHLPKPNVFNLYRLRANRKYQLYYNDVVSYEDALDKVKLNRTQKLQINTFLNNEVHVEKSKISAFINKIKYPISYFDFETFNEAIPRFNGQRPYQQMPFQYSLHIEEESGDLTHKEYLADETIDPRESLAIAMLNDIPKSGSILAFNQSFEISRIKELAKALPEYKTALLSLVPRFVDLIEPFRKLGYYHPEFHGSFSIKSILPAMFPNDPDLDYKQLDIQNGGMAMDIFAALPRLKNKEQRDQIRSALLAYCKLDTWAMVKIFNQLKTLLNS